MDKLDRLSLWDVANYYIFSGWDIESGKSIVKLEGKSGKIKSTGCCFPPKFANAGPRLGTDSSPDGRRIAASCWRCPDYCRPVTARRYCTALLQSVTARRYCTALLHGRTAPDGAVYWRTALQDGARSFSQSRGAVTVWLSPAHRRLSCRVRYTHTVSAAAQERIQRERTGDSTLWPKYTAIYAKCR